MLDKTIKIVATHVRTRGQLDSDTPLLSTGLIDSFHMVALLTDLEAQFNLRIDPADIGADNFDTVREIVAFIENSQ